MTRSRRAGQASTDGTSWCCSFARAHSAPSSGAYPRASSAPISGGGGGSCRGEALVPVPGTSRTPAAPCLLAGSSERTTAAPRRTTATLRLQLWWSNRIHIIITL